MIKNNKSTKSIGQAVIEKINAGQITMRSKAHFILKGLLSIGVIGFLILLILYLGSLIIFILRANDLIIISGLGWAGWRLILLTFPWYLVLGATLLIIAVEILAKQFTIVYRRPLIYSLLIIIALVAMGSWLVDRSAIHHSFFQLARENRLPIAGRFYERWGELELEKVHFGYLAEKEANLWQLRLDDGQLVELDLSELTYGRMRLADINLGQELIVIGDKVDKVIIVDRFRRINNRRGID